MDTEEVKVIKNFKQAGEESSNRRDFGNFSGMIFDFVITGTDLAEYITEHRLTKIDFTGCVFKQKIDCRNSDFFACTLVFKECRFFDLVVFTGSRFGKADFSEASFKEAASFIKAKFLEEVKFFHSEFCGVALFRAADFGTGIEFCETKFEKSAQFDGVNAQTLVFNNCTACVGFMFKNHEYKDRKSEGLKHVKALSFKNSLLGDTTDLDWEKDNVYNLLSAGKTDDRRGSDELIKQLGVFKHIYNAQGDYATEDIVYLALMKERKEYHRLNKNRIKTLAYGVTDVISKYGTSPLRILMVSVISIVFFGIIYLLIGAIQSNITLEILINALHGFVSPLNDCSVAIKIVSWVECVWGLFLASIFSATIVRKIIR